MKTFAILTSGGDSPGMNCAIRAFVRTLIFNGHKALGIRKGYEGLIQNKFIELSASSVGNIMQRGGTILQSSRSEEFKKKEFREIAIKNLKDQGVDGLVVIGGDGSFKGAYKLWEEFNFPVIGIPGTIDNDISGTEYTIGHNTAVETAIQAVDKIRDTAFSHDRVFLIEVMGRNSASIAIKTALCSGAENVILPHQEIDYDEIADSVKRGIQRGKKGSIFIVAEGAREGRSYDIQVKLRDDYQIQSRVCILGHIQRGGSPSPKDRLIASEMGHKSALALLEFTQPLITAVHSGKVIEVNFSDAIHKNNDEDHDYLHIIKTLSI